MAITLQELADSLSLALQGDGSCEIDGLASLAGASKGQLSFFDGGAGKQVLSSTKASAVILRESDLSDCTTNVLISQHPRLSFAKIAERYQYVSERAVGIHPSAVVGRDCNIDASVSVGPNAVIGNAVTLSANVTIGAGSVVGDKVHMGVDSVLDANVTVNHSVHIGARVLIASGAVIGSDGFGYTKEGQAWHKVPQLGTVLIGDDVEIGANTVIDRGAIDDTVIGNGVILDNLIQIAHNVTLGDYTAVAGCVGIAGSTTIGKHCSIGGGTGVSGHIDIADNVMLTGMSMVTNSIKKPGVYSSGTGLQANRDWHKSVIRFQQMDKLVKRVRALEKQVVQLKEDDKNE